VSADPFDLLRADTSPVAPATRFAGDLRRQLLTYLEEAMTDTTTTTTSTPAVAALSVTPYLVCAGADAAIRFYIEAFGAVEHHRLVGADGRVGHAEIRIGASSIMLADEYPEADALSPTSIGGSATSFAVSVDDVDAVFARAIALGGTEVRAVAAQAYGQRSGTLRDPFGHKWSIASPIVGVDDGRYIADMGAAGFEVQAGPASAAGLVGAHPQHKRHVPGDLYYFTLPTTDVARAQRFYGAVLGWVFADPEAGHVENITAPPGGLNASSAGGRPQLWFVVDDIHTAVERVRANGGTAEEPALYESGWGADCVDDQGVAFSLSVPSAAYGG
jgi:uncharacterized glyoxalase superfamily protein PhnB